MAHSPTTELLLERDMAAPESAPFLGGTAVLFSGKSPDRERANEDVAALLQYSEGTGLLAVADGAGGTRGGGDAARIAVATLRDTLAAADSGTVPLRTAVLNALDRANSKILALGTGAGTTIVLAEIHAGQVRPFHVGDSMILVCGQRGRVKLQNVPHGPVGYGVSAGLLDESAAMRHEQRHLVSNLLGSADMRIEVGSTMKIAARDTLVIASDGLTDNLITSEIVDTIRKGPLQEAAGTLLALCKRRMRGAAEMQPSKPDDLTFILYRLTPAS